MDITESLAPASDQLDAIDLATTGPQTFTVVEVSKGNAEQPVQIKLAEFPRVWRPSKGMRRVLAHCWGTDASAWAGHRVRLFNDPDVMFGKERTGGVRVSHVSHITGPQSVPMLVSHGKSSTYVVEPLVESAATLELDELRAAWKHATDPAEKERIEARVAELQAQETGA
jgi:hypothetical protein